MTDFDKTADGGDFVGAIALSSDTFSVSGATLTATKAGTYTVTVSLSDTANLMWVGGTHDRAADGFVHAVLDGESRAAGRADGHGRDL